MADSTPPDMAKEYTLLARLAERELIERRRATNSARENEPYTPGGTARDGYVPLEPQQTTKMSARNDAAALSARTRVTTQTNGDRTRFVLDVGPRATTARPASMSLPERDGDPTGIHNPGVLPVLDAETLRQSTREMEVVARWVAEAWRDDDEFERRLRGALGTMGSSARQAALGDIVRALVRAAQRREQRERELAEARRKRQEAQSADRSRSAST